MPLENISEMIWNRSNKNERTWVFVMFSEQWPPGKIHPGFILLGKCLWLFCVCLGINGWGNPRLLNTLTWVTPIGQSHMQCDKWSYLAHGTHWELLISQPETYCVSNHVQHEVMSLHEEKSTCNNLHHFYFHHWFSCLNDSGTWAQHITLPNSSEQATGLDA